MASTYLSRTPGTPTLSTKFTFSAWIKRSFIGNADNTLLAKWDTGNDRGHINFTDTPDDAIVMFEKVSNSTTVHLVTDRLFRDTSAWYHVVFEADSTQATASDRLKLYVNGVQETSFSTATYPSQNYNWQIQSLTDNFEIGGLNAGSSLFDGSMTHVHFIDGTAYNADTFGETDSITGIWKPKTAPSVTYGTNGFFLKFENSGSMGTDSSGNGNNFTVNGTCTQTIDTPSNVFATLNPIHLSGTQHLTNLAFSNGNNTVTSTNGGGYPFAFSTLGVSSGKYYAEFKTPTSTSSTMGISTGVGAGGFLGGGTNEYAIFYNGNFYNNGSGSSTGFDSWSDNDILGVAMDLDNNKIYFHKNGTYQNSGNPTAGTGGNSITAPSSNGTGVYHFACGDAGSGTPSVQANFGNGYFGTTAVSSAQNPDDGIGIFEYDVPAGYRALCTKSINAEEYS
jgi:hypothetical protein